MSSASARLTGTRSRSNCVIGCSDAVFLDDEVAALERGDETSGRVANGDGNGDELRFGAEALANVDRLLGLERRLVATKAIASPRQP